MGWRKVFVCPLFDVRGKSINFRISRSKHRASVGFQGGVNCRQFTEDLKYSASFLKRFKFILLTSTQQTKHGNTVAVLVVYVNIIVYIQYKYKYNKNCWKRQYFLLDQLRVLTSGKKAFRHKSSLGYKNLSPAVVFSYSNRRRFFSLKLCLGNKVKSKLCSKAKYCVIYVYTANKH